MPDSTIDLKHLGRVSYVASQLLETTAGPVLLDVGPGSTLDNLIAGLTALGLGVADLHAILLTHIHFDHAGATGLLVEQNPRLEVYVHERGAPHLMDPTKLVASATRVFGDNMDRLWGRFLPVPASQIRVLTGGEIVDLGDRRFDVAYTPGHASHHVSYYEAADRTAYVGDNGGIRVPIIPHPLPVTPPSDFNLEEWLATLDRIEAWHPRRVFSTHFGFSGDPTSHFAELRVGLHAWATEAKRLLETEGTDENRATAFEQFVIRSLEDKAAPEVVRAHTAFSDYKASWFGIARYWRKKGSA
jgi:glyoxylase-like metal-dependent hydrolase (beta-lactamase superfamily II)